MESTKRFDNRVELYSRYRPKYPPELLFFLERNCGFSSKSVVADIGSGTGLLSELLLRHGNRVLGIEPNSRMRDASLKDLAGYPRFVPIVGSAEDTTLPEHSVDLITAGHSFHWFDREEARREFLRILKPGGHVALIWNTRKPFASRFMEAVEELNRTFGIDYPEVHHKNVLREDLEKFFGSRHFLSTSFLNREVLDYDRFRGRMISHSFLPWEGDPQFEPMLEAIDDLFMRYQIDGTVHYELVTEVYSAQLSK